MARLIRPQALVMAARATERGLVMGPALALFWSLFQLPYGPPPVTLADLGVFPRPCYVKDCLEMNQEHERWLRRQGEWDPRHVVAWDDAADACQEAREPWQLLWCAQPSLDGRWPPHGESLDFLDQLRHRIGEAAYYSGRMPPLIPAWTVAERD